MTSPQRVVYLSAPEGLPPVEDILRFRLIYDGPLQPSQRDPENGQEDPIALHKHKIRQCFHGQLKQLWKSDRFLSTHRVFGADYMNQSPAEGPYIQADEDQLIPLNEAVARLYHENNYRFLPLVRDGWHLICNLDILFLRRDIPGSVIQAGDIDNRIKTLIDALRKPRNAAELRGFEAPQDGEDPFYCLLEDDKQVAGLRVESDTLLDPSTPHEADNRRVRLVISVEIRPYYNTSLNLSFV